MTGAPAWSPVLLLAGALLVWSPRTAVAARRIGALRMGELRPPGGPAARAPEPVALPAGRRRAWAGVLGLAVWLVLGGTIGVVAGLVVAGGCDRLLSGLRPAQDAAVRAARARELPAACDLLAVALSAGLPVGEALAAVGAALPAPLGAELRQVAALYRLGEEPRRAWNAMPAELAGLGRTLVRAGESGSAVGPALQTLAAESRTTARAVTETAVRRAGVWVLAPLGLCFLPAFLCLGVVPLVLGIAGEVFG
jgi:pilus assembly protein TadC